MVWIVYTALYPDGYKHLRDPDQSCMTPSSSFCQEQEGTPSGVPTCGYLTQCDVSSTGVQVPRGSIFIAPTDTVQNIKTQILTTSIPASKKNKPSKHAVTIGSSFGHVHAFLRDDNYVLHELERSRAEEKCLMLIKKPKSSSKQMLKSQSWTNLSVSDSHLHKQLDGGYHTNHRRNHKYRMKRKQSDLQPLPPESTDEAESLDNVSPRSSSNSDDGGFLTYRQRETRWTDDRTEKSKSEVISDRVSRSPYTSGHSDSTREINNNKSLHKGGRLYKSQNDIYLEGPVLVDIDQDQDKCRIKSDEFYSPEQLPDNTKKAESDSQDPMSRCHSLGDLTTGLTLSLVGQRKAESIQSLPIAAQPKQVHHIKRKNENIHRKKLMMQKERTDYHKNIKRVSNESQSHNFIPDNFNDCSTPKVPENSDPPDHSANYTQPKICNGHSHLSTENNSQLSQQQIPRQTRNRTDILPDKACGLTLIRADREDGNSSDRSSQSNRSNDKTPVKPRRSLPIVPQGNEEFTEKKKRYTEMMKMRMSLHSSNSRSSNSRQSVLSPSSETPKLSHVDETPSDREVSELLSLNSRTEIGGKTSVNVTDNTEFTNGHSLCTREHLLGNNGENVNTTLPSSVRSCDSGQTTVISLSSTMDSGYLTNDAENDMYSTSSYTRSLQRSAHSLYSASKLNNFTYGSMPRKDSLSGSKVTSSTDKSENINNRRVPSDDNDIVYTKVMSTSMSNQLNVNDETSGHSADSENVKNSYNKAENKASNSQVHQGHSQISNSSYPQEKIVQKNQNSISSILSMARKQLDSTGTGENVSGQNSKYTRQSNNSEEPRNVLRTSSMPSNNIQKDVLHRTIAQTVSSSVVQGMVHRNIPQTVSSSVAQGMVHRNIPQTMSSSVAQGMVHRNIPQTVSSSEAQNVMHRNIPQTSTVPSNVAQDVLHRNIPETSTVHVPNNLAKNTILNRTIAQTNSIPSYVGPQNGEHKNVLQTNSVPSNVAQNMLQRCATQTNNVQSNIALERGSASVAKSTGAVKTFRKDSMENLTNQVAVQNSTSKGLSYSYTLPRASNSSYKGSTSSGKNVNYSNGPNKNYNNNTAAGEEQLPNFGISTFAPVARQKRSASETSSVVCPEQVYPPVAGNLSASNYNTTSTSTSTILPTNQCKSSVTHDYVNVQGHDLRSELKAGMSLDYKYRSNPNLYSESQRVCLYCGNTRQEVDNKLTDTRKSEHSAALQKAPSLYQLLQKYDFHICKIKLGENSSVSDFIRILECSVTLPAMKFSSEKKENSVISSPQGKCAQLGGPGSAFKPVKTVNSSTATFHMTMVANIASHLPPSSDLGGLKKGDIIIEVNDVLVTCCPLSKVKEMLDSQPGDMILLVSRQEQEPTQEMLMKKDLEIDNLKKQLACMHFELQKKNKMMYETNLLSSWKQSTNRTREINGNHLGNEFIVNGLSEDEFIV